MMRLASVVVALWSLLPALAGAEPVVVLTDLSALKTNDDEYISHARFDPAQQTVLIQRRRTTGGGQRAPITVGLFDLRTRKLRDTADDGAGEAQDVRSPDGAFVVKQEGDHLHLYAGRGRHIRTLAPDRPASYQPSFSPDGKRVIFESYLSDREYHVVEEKVAGGLRERRDLPSLAEPVVFSSDGRWAYLHTRERSPVENQDKRECLLRADATLRHPVPLICHEADVAHIEMAFTPSRSHAVFLASDEQTTQMTRIGLPDRATAELAVPMRFGQLRGVFHDGERVVLGAGYTVVIADLVSQRRVSLGEDPFVAPSEAIGYSVWGIAGEHVIASRQRFRRTSPSTFKCVEEQLVSIDVDALLAQP